MLSKGVRPLVPYPGANKPWQCQCLKCGATVTPRYQTVVKMGKGGCNPCAKRNAAHKSKVEASKRAHQRAKELNLLPLDEYPGAHENWTLECLICGTISVKKAASVNQGKGCLKCNAGKGSREKMDRAEPSALAALKKAGLIPLTPYPGRHKPWISQCQTCGGITSPRVSGLINGQGGCVTCGRSRSAKSRSITEEDALVTIAIAFAKPIEPYPGSRTPWKSICLKCGLTISPRLASLRNGQSACKRCAMIKADSAFDYFGEAIIYLVKNEALSALKIGIAGSQTKRMAAHRQNGWSVVQVVTVPYGYQAWYTEGKILSWLRFDLGLQSCVESKDMPQGGFTETFPIHGIATTKLWKKVLSELSSPEMPIPQPILDGSAKRKARRTCTLVVGGAPCLNAYESNGYCRKHALAWRTYGDPLVTKKVKFENTDCLVLERGEKCGKPVDRKGMCSVHYYRNYVYGDPLMLKRPTPMTLPSECAVDECSSKPFALMKCQKHYHEDRRRNKR